MYQKLRLNYVAHQLSRSATDRGLLSVGHSGPHRRCPEETLVEQGRLTWLRLSRPLSGRITNGFLAARPIVSGLFLHGAKAVVRIALLEHCAGVRPLTSAT